MRKIITSGLILVMILGNVFSLYADRGIRKKSNNKISLNINTSGSFKNTIHTNINNGLRYNGVVVIETKSDNNNTECALINVYEKGSNVYIQKNKLKSKG
ncbi:MAG: hypothetical protein FGM46_00685 [Ferruginibacter sp.]|nr:hypothetical protein [Ferruginibacter sp.]